MLAIPPDFSFVVQIVSFFVLWLALKRLVWDPMLRVLEERESRTIGARARAEELQATASGDEAEYDRRLREVRSGLLAESKTARARVEAEEREIISVAHLQAGEELAALRKSLTQQAQEAREGLDRAARGLAQDIVQRVVGRPLS